MVTFSTGHGLRGALTSSLLQARWLFCVCRIDCDSYDSDRDVRKKHGEERLAALLRLKDERRTIRISDTESLPLTVESFSAKAEDCLLGIGDWRRLQVPCREDRHNERRYS